VGGSENRLLLGAEGKIHGGPLRPGTRAPGIVFNPWRKFARGMLIASTNAIVMLALCGG